jgi:hypothetical protein
MPCPFKRPVLFASAIACAASMLVVNNGSAQTTTQTAAQPAAQSVAQTPPQETTQRRPLLPHQELLKANNAQQQQFAITYVPSVRFDLIAGSVTAVQLGAGLMMPISNYFALGGTLGAGISETGFSGRGDVYTRFSLDPYHQYSWEPYFGVGGTVRLDSGGPGTRSYVLGFIGFNGPSTGRIAPGFELGVGGGIRLGVTLRWGK